MKPLWAVLHLAVIGMLVAVACGGAEPTATPPPTNTPQPTATATKAPTATAPAGQPTNPPVATATPAPTATTTRVPATATATQVKPKRGGLLRTEMTRNIDARLDLHAVRSSTTWPLMAPQLNWVVQMQQRKGVIEPDLAQSWTVSSDGITYTFKLTPNAKWQDGRPVTSDDIIYTFDRIRGKLDLAAPVYQATLNSVDSYTKIDDTTLQVKLKGISGTFLSNLTIIGNMVYPKHVPMSQFADNKPVGSGPFIWVSYQPDVQVDLKRDPNFWRRDEFGDPAPYLDGVRVFIIPDDSARRSAFVTGQLDVSLPHLSPFAGQRKAVEQKVPGVRWGDFFSPTAMILRSVPPYTDQRLRSALHLVLDRQAAAQVRSPGEALDLIAYSLAGGPWAISPQEFKTLPGYRQPKDQDQAQAKQLLDAALKDIGLTVDTWKPTANIQTQFLDQSSIALDQWKRVLGITVKVIPEDRPTSIQTQFNGTFQMIGLGTTTALDDPSQNLDPFVRCGSALNYGRFCDPAVDAALDEIERTLDPAKRHQLSLTLEKKLLDLAWNVFIVGDPRPQAVRPEVRNYAPLHAQDNQPNRFELVWLDK